MCRASVCVSSCLLITHVSRFSSSSPRSRKRDVIAPWSSPNVRVFFKSTCLFEVRVFMYPVEKDSKKELGFKS